VSFSLIKLENHIMLFNHDAKEVYLPLYAIPREDLTGPVQNITLRVRPAVVKWEGMSFISTSLAQELSPDNAADYAMVERIIKQKVGEATNH
jgi:hypothetical protein